MKTSAAGRKAITQREGNKLKAYLDSVGVLTIGVGHTSNAGPPKVTKGMTITAAESDAILSRDLATFERAVERSVKVPLSQNEFDALVSLAFNIGGGAFAKSTLVRKLNAGDKAGAAEAFLSWNKAGGKVLKGLVTRRQSERRQFLATGKPAQRDPLPEAPAAPSKTEPRPAAPAGPLRVDAILHRGSRGDFVAELQDHLNVLGFGPINVDGEFGYATERAVKAFQASAGLKADGWAGPRTLESIGQAIKDIETAPKLAAAEEVVDQAASGGKGVSKTEVITTVTGVTGVATVVNEAVDTVKQGATSLISLGPWILLALLLAGGAAWVVWDRRNKRLAARAAREVMR